MSFCEYAGWKEVGENLLSTWSTRGFCYDWRWWPLLHVGICKAVISAFGQAAVNVVYINFKCVRYGSIKMRMILSNFYDGFVREISFVEYGCGVVPKWLVWWYVTKLALFITNCDVFLVCCNNWISVFWVSHENSCCVLILWVRSWLKRLCLCLM